jgi:magnesium-protoporphyrin O-methyltransferase
MPCDCSTVGLNDIFGERVARHEARRFRRSGLPVRSRRLLDAIESAIPLKGTTSREVGAGVGGFTITLLRHGVAKASIVDAVPAYVSTARVMADEFGVAGRLDIELADYVVRAADLPYVDLVVMDRVVCCYPVWPDLLAAAAADARRVIALTYPRDAAWVRFGIAAINLLQRVRRQPFRVFVHPPAEMQRFLTNRGFRTAVAGHRGVWELLIAVRA